MILSHTNVLPNGLTFDMLSNIDLKNSNQPQNISNAFVFTKKDSFNMSLGNNDIIKRNDNYIINNLSNINNKINKINNSYKN